VILYILYTRPPVNTLTRSGDIELVDYIEPTQPGQIYNYPDLFAPQFPSYNRVPSYWSGTPPTYHTVDRLNINSCLENSINLDYIWIILLCFLILMLFFIIRIYVLKTKTKS